jgi:antitoxin component YwqK of YwqJK toxin-antitoxin module
MNKIVIIIVVLILLSHNIYLTRGEENKDTKSTSHNMLVEKYPNGGMKGKGLVCDDNKGNYHKEGKWTFWYENGKVKEEGEFEKGKKSGEWTIYDCEGKRIVKGTYNNDAKTGKWIFFNSEGNVCEELEYKDNLKNGIYRAFYDSGKKKEEGIFSDDKQAGLWQRWFETGPLEASSEYKNDLKDGKFCRYNEAGVLIEGCEYKNGKKHGEWILRDAKGNVYAKGNYNNGLKNGLFVTNYVGVILEENYENDLLSGKSVTKLPNGVITSEGCYKAGKPQGKFFTWDSKGNKVSNVYYDNNGGLTKEVSYDVNGGYLERIFSSEEIISQYYDKNNSILRKSIIDRKTYVVKTYEYNNGKIIKTYESKFSDKGFIDKKVIDALPQNKKPSNLSENITKINPVPSEK